MDKKMHAALEQTVIKVVSEYRARGYFPSAAVRVFDAKNTLCSVAAGDVREDTLFDVASLTKIATATQVLLAIDAKLIALTDEILSILPVLAESETLAARLAGVTVERLLTHTTGLVDWFPFYSEQGDFASVLETALKLYPPVAGTVYSDLNFMLLGKALEAIYGIPLEACLARNLAEPLSLGTIVYRPDPSWDIAPSAYGNPIEESMCAERGLTFSHWRAHTPSRGETNDGNAWYFFDGVAGHAGIFAKAEAYQRLGQFHLITDSPLLIDAQREHEPSRGLGWQVGDMYPKGCGHTGFTGTSIYISRELGIGVVAFTNRLFYPQRNLNPTNDFRRSLHGAVVDCVGEFE